MQLLRKLEKIKFAHVHVEQTKNCDCKINKRTKIISYIYDILSMFE
jgi:hypothetical protein